MTINSEGIPGLLDIAETSAAIFFVIFRCAKTRIEEGRIKEMHVQPHAERVGPYALVSLAGRTELPAVAFFREFAHAHSQE
jgi:hypothetical protein